MPSAHASSSGSGPTVTHEPKHLERAFTTIPIAGHRRQEPGHQGQDCRRRIAQEHQHNEGRDRDETEKFYGRTSDRSRRCRVMVRAWLIPPAAWSQHKIEIWA